ncbi:hypothetical protein [Curtobacterium phage Parvaparticeps]|nr:hypothetical protein [Curtobacterium phage Parvaparticeps]
MISDALATTIVTSITAIILAIIAAPAGKRAVQRAKQRRLSETEGRENEQQKSIDQFTTDPVGWAEAMFKQTQLAMSRAAAAEAKADRIEKKFDEKEREHRQFRSAVVRWLVKIRNLFVEHEIEMPYPAQGDVETLAEVIPLLMEATYPKRPTQPRPTQAEDYGA